MASNPYVNKVEVNGSTIIDLTADTVDASHLYAGYTAHDLSGALITGTMTGPGSGAYNIVSTTNQDGTQNLAITDATPISIDPLTITANGTYTPTSGHAYGPVTVSVPSSGGEVIEVSDETTLNYCLSDPLNIGKAYRFTGSESLIYVTGDIYVVES